MVQRGEALVLRIAAVLADGAPKFVVTWTGISVNQIWSALADEIYSLEGGIDSNYKIKYLNTKESSGLPSQW